MFLEHSVTQSGDGEQLWGCLFTTTSLEGSEPAPDLAEALSHGPATGPGRSEAVRWSVHEAAASSRQTTLSAAVKVRAWLPRVQVMR